MSFLSIDWSLSGKAAFRLLTNILYQVCMVSWVLQKNLYLIFVNAFVNISLWKVGGDVHLNKLESKDALCKGWLKLARCFNRRYSNYINVIFLYYIFLRRRQGLSFKQSSIPFTLECFVSCCVETDAWSVVLEKKMKM